MTAVKMTACVNAIKIFRMDWHKQREASYGELENLSQFYLKKLHFTKYLKRNLMVVLI